MNPGPAVGEDLLRELAPQVLARLVRTHGAGQFDVCEDAVQDALLAAYRQWPADPPSDPLAWLVTTARRRYVDRVRVDSRRREREAREALLAHPLSTPPDGADPDASPADDSLLLLQLCCHPALARPAQVALTLRAVAGLTTAQIANVLQLPETTVAQRITRAKRRLAELGGDLPRPRDAAERLSPVLDVLYVMLTEAHHTTSGTPARDTDLAAEAIHLARLLRRALPNDPEVSGLLALMLLTASRGPARQADDGSLVPLDEQDRTRWDQTLVREGVALVEATVPGAAPGPYLLQACIAALHAEATDTASTDWSEILALYGVLEVVTGRRNPTIALNRIVAEAQVLGDDAALASLDDLERQHPGLPRLDAVRAHLLERQGRTAQAADAYRHAARATRNLAEQQYLQRRLRALRTP
ncbi:sigma-70 family RNA polymerase sigma factor [Promicromonospora sp. NPDC050262]|uniref:RNA polymerase sigma factor n=1 Tax=Promicromonospora sp. NPDC050262 TaxID=3155036 RepID=UPI0033C12B3A